METSIKRNVCGAKLRESEVLTPRFALELFCETPGWQKRYQAAGVAPTGPVRSMSTTAGHGSAKAPGCVDNRHGETAIARACRVRSRRQVVDWRALAALDRQLIELREKLHTLPQGKPYALDLIKGGWSIA
jgi:hypothetical protein